jgi:hypothetical protein
LGLQTIYWLPLRKSILNNCIIYTNILANGTKCVLYLLNFLPHFQNNLYEAIRFQHRGSLLCLLTTIFTKLFAIRLCMLKRITTKSLDINAWIHTYTKTSKRVTDTLLNGTAMFWYIPDFRIFFIIKVRNNHYLNLVDYSDRNFWTTQMIWEIRVIINLEL